MLATPSILTYSGIWKRDKTKELRNVISQLEEQNYYAGYVANFWNGNVLTELSSGKIDVWTLQLPSRKSTDLSKLHKWLQLKAHTTRQPDGPVFFLFNVPQKEEEPYQLTENMSDDHIVYQSDSYVVYGYPSVQEAMRYINGYRFQFGDGTWLLNGRDEDGRRRLQQDGCSYGPYITAYPGRYTVDIKGENLEKAQIYCTFHNGKGKVPIIEKYVTDDYATFSVEITEELSKFEVVVRNKSDQDIFLDSIVILGPDKILQSS